jgi:hypothetical protein
MQCFNNISCDGFEFAMSYLALPGFVNDPLSILLLQTSKTDNNELDIDAIYNLKLRKT